MQIFSFFTLVNSISESSAYRSGNQGGIYLTANALMDKDRNPFSKMNVAYINQHGNLGRPMGGNQGGQGGNHGIFNNIIK